MHRGSVLKALHNDSQSPLLRVYSLSMSFLFIILKSIGKDKTLPLMHSLKN